ncbi:hypothetical protein ABW19_dt0205414 [Dactylella cylindrospora]|nr:hypothetical protein ABW19_dt0205414 [Dactylella cylindrospora]
MNPRGRYENLPASSAPSYNYVNPAFQEPEYSNPTVRHPSWTDPLPSTSQFQPLSQLNRPSEPLLQSPPNTQHLAHISDNINPPATAPIGSTMPLSPPLVSPISPDPTKKSSNRTSMASRLSASNPTSPAEKRPSRFTSDFSHFKRASWHKSPDPAFRAHRRTFSEEARRYTTSSLHEDALEEEEDEPNTNINNQSPNSTNNNVNVGLSAGNNNNQGTGEIFQAVPLESRPGDLGLRYVMSNDGLGKSTYHNLPPDDDDYSDDGASLKKVKKGSSWLNIMILLLCVYSTIGSLLFFIIAAAKPRYGTIVSTNGRIKPQDAQLMSAIFAKTIELSFVSVFVSFLGQVLSRRALMTGSKGVNIAELSMRSWVTQPGTLLTHTPSLRFAGLTFLGALSLTATVFASFYTTASDTLVSPKLNWGRAKVQNMTGIAYAQYADPAYRGWQCRTVITPEEDPAKDNYIVPLSQDSCVNILSAGNGYRDVSDYLALWASANTTSSTDPKNRPPAPSSHELVNYQGTWLSVTGANGINNATMVMPHAGLVNSAKNTSLNGILQPENADGYGSYVVKAAIPNPAVNSLCVALTPSQLDWFIAQPSATDLSRNGSLDSNIQQIFDFSDNATYVFTDETGTLPKNPYEAPRFPKRPIEYNTVLFSRPSYADPSIYLLVRTNNPEAEAYTMCGVRSFVTPDCSTEFQAIDGGGNVTVNCDPNNPWSLKADLERRRVDPVQDTSSINFKYIGIELARSVALGTGVSDANASIARVFSQFALDLSNSELRPNRPSLAEMLAVLFGNAIITSSVDSVFTTYFEYGPDAPQPYYQYFNAEVASIEYSSGAGSGWKPLFYVVLAGVLLLNVFCLLYFSCSRDGFVTDWTEVQNLFCVVMDGGALSGKNRVPATERSEWKGTGGTGPMGEQYKVGFWFTEKSGRWYVTDMSNSEKGKSSSVDQLA